MPSGHTSHKSSSTESSINANNATDTAADNALNSQDIAAAENNINTPKTQEFIATPNPNQHLNKELETGKEEKALSSDELKHWSTAALKQQILRLTENRDADALNQKMLFLKNSLLPLFEELSRRNPYKQAEEQVSLVIGAWSPRWSTIPFQDTIPGRIREQSYQIFQENGYYANIARYAPGHKLSFLQKLSSILIAYDLMLIQKFDVHNGQWYIQNVDIKQALRLKAIPLSINKAEEWFTNFVKSIPQGKYQIIDSTDISQLENLDKGTAKRFKKTFLATPQFEHLYIDHDFRLVKTQRETKQRPSYTVAVRN